MAIDPNLAMKIGQYGATQMPDYGNMLVQATNIQGARQTQQMNALKMQEDAMMRQRAEEERQIYAAAVGPEGYNPAQAMRLAGERGQGRMVPDLLEQQRKAAEAQRADQEAKTRKFDSDRKAIGMLMGGADTPEEFEEARRQLIENGIKADKIPPYSPETRSMLNRWAQTPEQRSAEQKVSKYIKSADGTTYGVNEQGKPVVAYGPGLTPTSMADGRMSDMQFAYNNWQKANPNGTFEQFIDTWTRLKGPSEDVLEGRTQDRLARQRAAELRSDFDNRRLALQQQIANARTETDRKRYELQAKQEVRRELERQQREEMNTPEARYRLANAEQTGRLAAKDDTEAIRTLPNTIASAEYRLQVIDELVGDAEIRGGKLYVPPGGRAPHPGFEGAVGIGTPFARFIPGTAANAFDGRLDQIKGQSFLEAFETLKGGGHITEIEGTKGTVAINRMALAQSEAEFLDAARELRGIVKKGLENARKRLSDASSRTSAARAPITQPSAAPALQSGEAASIDEVNRDIAVMEKFIVDNPKDPNIPNLRATINELKAGRR
jgi:hypothetical protein